MEKSEPLLKKKDNISYNSDNGYAVFINSSTLNSDTETNKISTSKYQWYSFFPKMLMEQFARLANAYFLIIAILQSIKEISYSSGSPVILFPLSIVILINGLKDLFEDMKRKKSDNEENNNFCLVYDKKQRQFVNKKWKEIVLGDIVKVMNDHQFPADLILLNSSEPNGICYVETKNIDGETNLKFRQSNKTLKEVTERDEMLADFNYVCLTRPPNEFIYQFDATFYQINTDGLILDKTKFLMIDKQSFLLRGSYLKQTDYIIGVVVYVGHNTKSMINSPNARAKTSSIERIMNYQIITIFFLQIFLSSISSIIHVLVYKNHKFSYLSLEQKENNYGKLYATILGTWILIFTNFVPISLLVTMESIKFFQAIMIMWDVDMYDRFRHLNAKVQTSTLNEELGQVKYVFSDKTGTLTKNYMQYKTMSIGAEMYGNETNPNQNKHTTLKDEYGLITNVDYYDPMNKLRNDLNSESRRDIIHHFLLCLSLCNTVITDSKKYNTSKVIEYQASSPDEKALIYFARSQGYIFISRSIDNKVTLQINGENNEYEILNILEYSSERKRMGVIVRAPNGKIYLYSKGADSTIEQLLTQSQKESNELRITNEHLSEFAIKGLRTLMIAYKELELEEYKVWNDKYIKISLNVNRNDDEFPNLYDEIEHDFLLLGATAIEDQLQDNVDETINSLISIGIKVWMLTGDKLDTAKNIAYSCRLFNNSMTIISIKEHSSLFEIKHYFDELLEGSFFQPNKNYGLLISSEELTLIFNDNETLDSFYKICIKCISVVCSRVSPKQKAEMVNLIKTTQKAITLAIGDGANDVGMINEASVGIGIQGIEGTQAARASDYSIAEFSFLKKLLFFHGREAYRRNSYVVCYNFYKNVLFVIPQFWAGMKNIFSGQTLFESWIYQLFNPIFSAIPIGWYGIFDIEHESEILVNNPKYYIQGIYGKLFHYKRFWKWVLSGMYQGFLLFYFSFNILNSVDRSGKNFDFWGTGMMVYQGIVLIANLKIFVNTNTHTIFSHTFIFLSIIAYYIILAGFSSFDWPFKRYPLIGDLSMIICDLRTLLGTFEMVTIILILDIFIQKILIFTGIVKEGDKLPPYNYHEEETEQINFEKKPIIQEEDKTNEIQLSGK